ncbi:hypothetical protein [Desulfitobacterium sp.]|uniref:hypothetical protein n=1 Tax=Desulfitobacterium sp. TaxID=49981 RepID=UPI002B1F14C6|nr:hypothetical protein [Desulfitobacterium sp.]MEA4902552.1 hypothetical protein [Desulfitobacterium sp.]
MILFLYVILSFLYFVIIYAAVRLAINPLIPKSTDLENDKDDDGLVKLRDIEVLTDMELEEIIELYHNNSVNNKEKVKYEKYLKLLNELKEIEFFTDEEYANKKKKLDEYYHNQ